MPGPHSAEWPLPVVFYDGDCGLCHGTVRFVLAHDEAAIFRFAPLCSPAFERMIPAAERSWIPDSVVVRTTDQRTVTQSDAIVEILRQLGGVWGLLATLLRAVPRPIRNTGYRFVASVRASLFARPTDACPVMAPDLRARFLFD